MISTRSAHLDELERRLSDARARAKVSALRGAFRAFPRLAGSLLEVAAAGFSLAPIPRFFSPNVREISPALNDDLLDLYGRAGQTLANRFTFFNSPRAFEANIDWEPAETAAWRSELHAFDYALELACTFRISREEKYARHLRYLIAHWIAANPPAAGTGWQLPVLARRARNWMLAADSARLEWEFDTEFSTLAARSLALQLAFLLAQLDSLPSPAARLDGSRALLCAGRFFAGSSARRAYDAGFDLLSRALTGIRSEPWPHSILARAEALMEWLLLSPSGPHSAFLVDELNAAMDELARVLMPNGSLPLLGPQARLNHDDLADLAALAAVKLESPEWKNRAGGFGILPHLWLGEEGKQRFENLPDVAISLRDRVDAESEILRMAGPRNSALVVAARPPRSSSEHQDFTSYELTIDDHRMVVDSGGFAPDETAYFSRARAHNLLLVDGRDPQWSAAESLRQVDFQNLSGDSARLRISDSGFRSIGIEHHRAWFRLANNNWVVLDWLQGQGIHHCTSLMHLYPTFEAIEGEDRILARSGGHSFEVIPMGSARPHASVTRGDHPRYPGWYSPDFGIKFAAAVLVIEWEAELPWVGGALITSSANQPVRQISVHAERGSVSLEFAGQTYDFSME